MAAAAQIVKQAGKQVAKRTGKIAGKNTQKRVVGAAEGIEDTIYGFYAPQSKKMLEDTIQNPRRDSTLLYMTAEEYFDFSGQKPMQLTPQQKAEFDVQLQMGQFQDVFEMETGLDGGTLVFGNRLTSKPNDPSIMDYFAQQEPGSQIPVVMRMGDDVTFDDNFEIPLFRDSQEGVQRDMFRTPLLRVNRRYDQSAVDLGDERMHTILDQQPTTPEAIDDAWANMHNQRTNAYTRTKFMNFQMGVQRNNLGIQGNWRRANNETPAPTQRVIQNTSNVWNEARAAQISGTKALRQDERLWHAVSKFTKGSKMKGEFFGDEEGMPMLLFRGDMDVARDPATNKEAVFVTPRETGAHFGPAPAAGDFAGSAEGASIRRSNIMDKMEELHSKTDIEWEEFVDIVSGAIGAAQKGGTRRQGAQIFNLSDDDQFMFRMMDEIGNRLSPDLEEPDLVMDALIQELKNTLDIDLNESINQVYVANVQKPMILAELGGWRPADIARQLQAMAPYKDKYTMELAAIVEFGDLGKEATEEYVSATRTLQRVLEKEGYDAIGYINTVEPRDRGAGIPSYIIWDEKKLMKVAEEIHSTRNFDENLIGSLFFAAMGIGTAGTAVNEEGETSNVQRGRQ